MQPRIPLTPFAAWLTGLMEDNQPRPLSRSQLAHFMKPPSKPSIVGQWFTKGVIPSTDYCLRIAALFGVEPGEVLRRAGHLPALSEAEEREQPAPRVLAEARADYDAIQQGLPTLRSRHMRLVAELVRELSRPADAHSA